MATKATKSATSTKSASKTKAATKKVSAVKKTTPAKKTTITARDPQFIIEYANQRISTDDILKKIKDDLKSKGAKGTATKALDIYVQPENNDVYYVSNSGTVKEITGKVDLI
jgi:hypothetical protein